MATRKLSAEELRKMVKEEMIKVKLLKEADETEEIVDDEHEENETPEYEAKEELGVELFDLVKDWLISKGWTPPEEA